MTATLTEFTATDAGLPVAGRSTGSLYLAVAILGATVMPHVIYLHSALTKDRTPSRDERDRHRLLSCCSPSSSAHDEWFPLRDCRSWPGRLRPRPERRQHGPHGVGDRFECLVVGQLADSGRDAGVDRVGDGVERRGQPMYRVG